MSLSSRKGESLKGILGVICNRREVLLRQKLSTVSSFRGGPWTTGELHRKAESFVQSLKIH